VPKQYFPQVQTQLEVCDFEVCDFIQFRPAHFDAEGKHVPEIFTIKSVPRDRDWFAQHVNQMKAFHDKVQAYRTANPDWQESKSPK